MTIVPFVLAFVGGYAASIYTWSKLKVWINGAQAEADKLRAKADAMAAAVKKV